MQHVEGLAGLRDGAKERVIAARAFLVFVETYGSALGVTFGGEHAAVEV